MADIKLEIISCSYELYKSRGYVTEDEIFGLVAENNISLFETNAILEALLDKGVLIQDKPLIQNKNNDDDYDLARIDYDVLYQNILKVCPHLKIFIKKVASVAPPKRNEWVKLLEQSKAGNAWASNRLFEMYLRVVVNRAWVMYKKYDLSLDDAIQDGCLGLMYALEKFDITENNSLPGYIPFAISNYIKRNIAFPPVTEIEFPAILHEILLKCYPVVKKHHCTFCIHYGVKCPQLINDIIEELECSKDEALSYLYFFQERLELEESSLGSFDIEQEILEKDALRVLSYMLHELPDREEYVLKMRWGIDFDEELSLEEIGLKFNITRERVRQIENKGIKRLKHTSRILELQQLFNMPLSNFDKTNNLS